MIQRSTIGTQQPKTFGTARTFTFTKRLTAKDKSDLTTTTHREVPSVTTVESPRYKMPAQNINELVYATAIAAQAFGNSLWAKQAIQERQQDRTSHYSLAL